MKGFHDLEGNPVEGDFIEMTQFMLGNGRMQCMSGGVVLMDDGAVRRFYVRHPHNSNLNGHLCIMGDPIGSGLSDFHEHVRGFRSSESMWITDEIRRSREEWNER